MLVVMTVTVALVSLSGLTLLTVRTTTAAAGHARFHSMALYAAESGLAAGMQFLRENLDPADNWTELVVAGNAEVVPNAAIAGNAVKPGATGYTLSADSRAWYEVEILNNENDPGFELGTDDDQSVILRSTGHGPNGAVAIVEITLQPSGGSTPAVPCTGYAQENMSEHGAGFNPCVNAVNNDDTQTFRMQE